MKISSICSIIISSTLIRNESIISNTSIFWISLLLLVLLIPSIKISSPNSFSKGSFSFFWIKIILLDSIMFSGLGVFNISLLYFILIIFFRFWDLNIVNFSVFCILLSGFIFLIDSIYKLSTNCFFNASFSLGNIVK